MCGSSAELTYHIYFMYNVCVAIVLIEAYDVCVFHRAVKQLISLIALISRVFF